jgi:hypothetical protein
MTRKQDFGSSSSSWMLKRILLCARIGICGHGLLLQQQARSRIPGCQALLLKGWVGGSELTWRAEGRVRL